MRVVAVCCVAAFAFAQAALAESKKDWDDCVSSDADRSIAGCSKIISSAKDTKTNLAIAYFNRGVGHQPLVIGNGAYANVKALKNADSDARAIAASLRQLGFEVIEKHDLTLADLTKELKAFGDCAPGYD